MGVTGVQTCALPISPVTTPPFVPGDSLTRTVNLTNNGTSALGSVVLDTTAGGTVSKLTSDTVNGLQLSVKSCSVAWSASYTCAGTERPMGAGSAVSTLTLSSPNSLNPGGVDYLAF